MDDRDLLRYSRHILLDEIGIEGQEHLLAATVLIVGCGGLGSAAAPYLTASGCGHLILADNDNIDDTNLQRQTAYTEADVGRNKAATLKTRLQAINSRAHISTLTNRLDEAALVEAMRHADIVLDCSDNFPTRQAINRASVHTRTPLVSGAAVRFEGQTAVYRPDLPDTPCYACLFDGVEANDGTCALFGVFSPLVGIIGTMQAASALNILTGTGSPQYGKLHTYNALANCWQSFRFSKNPQCRVCSTHHSKAT